MRIKMIAAVGQDWELGKKGQLIWRLPEDLKYFKRVTTGHKIVMGRKTWQSIGRALPDRENIVMSRSCDKIDGTTVIHSIDELDKIAGAEEVVYVIGGQSIYQEFLPYAEEMILTHIEGYDTEADAYFPAIRHDDYRIEDLGRYRSDNNNYIRRRYTKNPRKG